MSMLQETDSDSPKAEHQSRRRHARLRVGHDKSIKNHVFSFWLRETHFLKFPPELWLQYPPSWNYYLVNSSINQPWIFARSRCLSDLLRPRCGMGWVWVSARKETKCSESTEKSSACKIEGSKQPHTIGMSWTSLKWLSTEHQCHETSLVLQYMDESTQQGMHKIFYESQPKCINSSKSCKHPSPRPQSWAWLSWDTHPNLPTPSRLGSSNMSVPHVHTSDSAVGLGYACPLEGCCQLDYSWGPRHPKTQSPLTHLQPRPGQKWANDKAMGVKHAIPGSLITANFEQPLASK